ncbi:MAG: acyl carrier protein [Halothiobacillaceae bacterium]|nr:MAG: acyl carrier protein [Halothiobacillaceae bacterium]
MMTQLERDVAQLIIDALNIEDMDASEIDPDAPLFRDGLGLDSIDALEIALAISRQYGFQLRSDSADNAQIFSSLRALSEHIASHRS